MYSGNKHAWTAREDAILSKWWEIGSAADVAGRIGVSKNSAISRANRLGLSAKPAPIHRVEPALPTPDLISNAFYQAAPERRARGYAALKAGDPISWGAIAGHVTVMA